MPERNKPGSRGKGNPPSRPEEKRHMNPSQRETGSSMPGRQDRPGQAGRSGTRSPEREEREVGTRRQFGTREDDDGLRQNRERDERSSPRHGTENREERDYRDEEMRTRERESGS